MKLDTTDLCYRGKPLDAVNLEIRLLVAEDLGQLDKVGGLGHGVALKELPATDAIGCPDDRAWTTFDMVAEPGANGLVMSSEILLRHWLIIAGTGSQRLVGARNQHAPWDSLYR